MTMNYWSQPSGRGRHRAYLRLSSLFKFRLYAGRHKAVRA